MGINISRDELNEFNKLGDLGELRELGDYEEVDILYIILHGDECSISPNVVS